MKFLPFLCATAAIAFGATASIDPNLYLNDVKFLASPELKGRATGSPELEKAAAFIAQKFKEFGLKPVGDKGFLQSFSVTTSAQLGKNNHLRVTAKGQSVALTCPTDFIPFHFSPSAKLSAPVVFAGYGITAPELKYDDYAGVDVKGKIVVVLRHEPQENDDKSIFAGKRLTSHALFANKATNAKMHGAAGIILVNDVANHPGDGDTLAKFGGEEGPDDVGIPFLQIKEARVEEWFTEAGKNLKTLEAAIDKDVKPESFAFPDNLRITGELDLQRVIKTVHNVAGYLPGETDEYVIVGAHYDHLGLGGQYSLAPSMTGTVHPGADDNASGTAGVIELARYFSTQPKQKRGMLFLTFAGEEMGLLGSNYYVGHPEVPIAKAVAMLNMDMIGRVRDSKVYVGGVGTGSNFRSMLDKITPRYAMKMDYSETGESGGSDHTSFIIGKVPSLFFFSGLHSDYHKPGDTWDKIDAPDAAKVLDLVAEVATTLRQAEDRPQYIRVAPPSAHGEGAAGPVSSSSGGGYGPYFGSIPDFGEGVKGVKLADVRDGSPAGKAGFKAGDIMVEFDGKPIQNLYDFTYALQQKKPGDEIKVKVMRDGKPVEASVLLTKRQ